ncbi:MAG: translocation/assembly module TamB domain-containing protein [Bacteroidales bacterium]
MNLEKQKEKKNYFKKTSKVVGYCLLTIFLIVYLFMALLNTSIVQSILAAKISDFFSKEWKTELRIGALSVNVFEGIKIKDVYLESQKGDTILYADNISVKIYSIPSTHHIKLSRVSIETSIINIETGKDGLNFQFILDYFQSDKSKPLKDKKPFVLDIYRVKIKDANISLKLRDNHDVYPPNLVAINNMRFREVDADFQNMLLINDSINIKVNQFKAKELSGFEVQSLIGDIVFSSKGMILKNTNLITPNSNLFFDVQTQTNSWKAYGNFIDSVYFEGEIKKGSKIGMKDATYWIKSVKGSEQKADLIAKFNGRVNDLFIEHLEINTGNETNLIARGRVTGLPYPDKTIYDIYAEDFQTSYVDYKSMKLGDILNNLPIPPMIANLGKIKLNASFAGLISNFNAIAEIETEIGNLDLIGSSITNGKSTTYYADLLTQEFNIGTLLNNPLLGTTQFGAKAEVTGTSLNNLKGNLIANITNTYLKGHNYDSIYFDGQIENKEITAQFYLKDGRANLIGSADYSLSENKSLYLDAKFQNINPYILNLYKFADSTAIVSGSLIADIQNLDMKNLNGNLSVQDLKFEMSQAKPFIINRFNAQISSNNEASSLALYSDILDLSMVGKYDFEGLGKDISWLIKKYIPSFKFLSSETQDFVVQEIDQDYEIQSKLNFISTIKNAEPVFALFAPNVSLSNNTIIDGSLSPQDKLNLNFRTNKIGFSGITLSDIKINSKVIGKDLYTSLNTSRFAITDSLLIRNVVLDVISNSKKVDLVLNFADKYVDNRTKGHINFKSIFTNNSLQGSFEDSQFEVYGSEVIINNNNIIGYNGEQLAILNLSLNKMNENITINGIASNKISDQLEIDFNNVDLSAFNPIFKQSGIEIGGRINRNITFKSLFNKPSLTSNLVIDSLSLNNNFLGIANLNVSNTLTNDEFFVNIKLLYKGIDGIQNTPLTINGFIYPQNKNKNMDLNLSLKNFNLNVIEKFLNSFSSEAEGFMSGEDIKIRGKFSQPDIIGTLICEKGAIKIDMINTKYYFSDTLTIKNNKFILNKFKLTDIENNKLVIDGIITHEKFQEFYINLIVNAEKIKILNTRFSADQMYYGEAYASARASIMGDLSVLKIDVNAKTEKGTSVYIPISSKINVSNNSFIQFIDFNNKASDTISKPLKFAAKEMDLNIHVNLKVTPDALIGMPMNFNQIGGDLNASGEGDLKMDIDNKGKFNMYGLVNIESGTFGLSLMNVIEKTFILEKGGTIQFNGNPTNANLNVNAVYKTKASLAPILGKAYVKQVDVQSVISLSGKLMNPVPTFDIRLPNTDQQTIDDLFINIDKNDEKQMLEQTVSLLVSRQFYASSSAVESNIGGSNISSSAFELAFGQITGMLTNMITVVDVGVNYTPGSEVVTDQYDLNISKNIGRWEVEFNSVFGGKTEEQAQGASSFIGDIKVEYKITENFRLKAFNKSNADDFTKYNISPYTQGVGITYKKEYDHFADIFKSRKQRNKVLK